MILRNTVGFFLLLFAATAVAQENFNLELVSQYSFTQDASDVWGYVDSTGREYAVVGLNRGTSVLSLEDPYNPELLVTIPGATSIWRDMKSWKHFVYTVADRGTDGLLIIDMSQAPEDISWTFWNDTISIQGESGPLNRCHNLYIDDKGIMYLAGCNQHANGAILMFDLNPDPQNPLFLGPTDFDYAHDVFARGDTVYSSQIIRGQLAVFDVKDKQNPTLMGSAETSLRFTHNLWPSDDGKYLFSTDERPNGRVDAYDITHMEDIIRLDEFAPLDVAGKGTIPHNVHYKDGYLVVSWYTSGCVVIDAHRPSNLVQVGSYDTFLGPDGGFNGAWGAYPWLPSGLVLVSDIQSGLFVLQPEYKRAAYLEGMVTDTITGLPIQGVEVQIRSERLNQARSNFSGEYKTGLAEDGWREVVFSHPNYLEKSVWVQLEPGEVTFLNVGLIPMGDALPIELLFVDTLGQFIPDVKVWFSHPFYHFEGVSDSSGRVSTTIFEGAYDLYVGKWSYENKWLQGVSFPSGVDTAIVLKAAYEDDFEVDLGWQVKLGVAKGDFERGIPMATFYKGMMANPGSSSPQSSGPYCYVTGAKAGDSPFDFNVEGGKTEFKSPGMDLSNYREAAISFDYWFFNEGEEAPAENVEFKVVAFDGEKYYEILKTKSSASEWKTFGPVPLRNFFDYADKPIEIIFVASDFLPFALVEAGVDNFKITDLPLGSNQNNRPVKAPALIYPNPGRGRAVLEWGDTQEGGRIQVLSSQGIWVHSVLVNPGDTRISLDLTHLSPGIYHLLYQTQQGEHKVLGKYQIIDAHRP
jgi:choice-of-anchor B domain-containing protein